MLVDIDDTLVSSVISQQDDDPFELCSMQGKASKKDLGLELGLALEKSIKLHAQSNQNEPPSAVTRKIFHNRAAIV